MLNTLEDLEQRRVTRAGDDATRQPRQEAG
jgi:hypothetical protein